MGPPKPPRDPLRMSARDLHSGRRGEHGIFAAHANHLQPEATHQYSGGRRVKRRDSHLRRHTLQGGVDFSMVSQTALQRDGEKRIGPT